MDLFSLREMEIFEGLRRLTGTEFVVIGGYAVNAYAPPRFSVDCDVVVENGKHAERMAHRLVERGFKNAESGKTPGRYGGAFVRMEKTLGNGLKASFDLLIREVYDQRTRARFSFPWIHSHSARRVLRGKTFPSPLETRIADADALVVMKLVASRKADLRDVFMLAPQTETRESREFVRREVSQRTDWKAAIARASETILSKEFRKNVEGVYGGVDEKTFQRHVEAFRKLAALE